MKGKRILLRHKYPHIIELISMESGLPLRDSLKALYTSDIYKDVNAGIGDTHCRSDGYIAEEVMGEKGIRYEVMPDPGYERF
jgi:hypothetical protein